MQRLVVLVSLCVAFACGPAMPPAKQTNQQQQPPNGQQQEAIAPQPFTPEQIAAAMPVGTVVRYRFEPMGQGTYEEIWTVTAADATKMTMRTQTLNPDGTQKDESADATWEEVANHGAFPQSATTIVDGEITVPAGTFKTKLYTITAQDAVTRMHFAPELPGPPVLLEMDKGGQRIMTMTLLARDPRPAPPAP